MTRVEACEAKSASLSEKMRRGDLMSTACPSREVLKHLTSRWGVLVLITLLTGTHRFSALRRK
jgi:DNA-binding HxlR family transcriptional regulator